METVAVDLEHVAGAVVVHVRGEVDIESSPVLTQQLANVHQVRHAERPVVLDLTGVTFLSSSGVAAVVSFAGRCAEDGVPLRVVPTLMIRALFSITGVNQMLRLAATVDDALASLRGTTESDA